MRAKVGGVDGTRTRGLRRDRPAPTIARRSRPRKIGVGSPAASRLKADRGPLFRNILQVLASGSRTAAIGSGANRVERHFLPSPAENWPSTAPSGSENRVAITTVTHNIRRARGVDTHRGAGSPCTVRAHRPWRPGSIAARDPQAARCGRDTTLNPFPSRLGKPYAVSTAQAGKFGS